MEWIDLLGLEDLPDRRPLGLMAGGAPVVLVRRDSDVVALRDACPHLGAPLRRGHLDADDRLVCPSHGWSFDIFAKAVNGELPGGCIPIPVRIRHGRIEVRPG